jgi:hypothetical protein
MITKSMSITIIITTERNAAVDAGTTMITTTITIMPMMYLPV